VNPQVEQLIAESRSARFQGKPKKAEQLALQALALDPEASECHNCVGEAFLAQGRFDDAYAEFAFAVSREPGNPAFTANLQRAAQRSNLAAGQLADEDAADPHSAAQVIQGIAQERYAARGIYGRLFVCALLALCGATASGYAVWQLLVATAFLKGGAIVLASVASGIVIYMVSTRLFFRRELRILRAFRSLGDPTHPTK
jgi:tetratricopeptide (TPR) repeat protein